MGFVVDEVALGLVFSPFFELYSDSDCYSSCVPDVSGHPEGKVPALCFPRETCQDYIEKLGIYLSENVLRLHDKKPMS